MIAYEPSKQLFRTILVEGGIGNGKTHFTKRLAARLGPKTLVLWEQAQEHGNPYLDDFYYNKKRWGLTLQLHQLSTRFRQHKLAQWWVLNRMGDAVLDRGFQGDTCFAKMLHEQGEISTDEYLTYADTYQNMTASVLLPTICCRLVVPIEISMERIKKRQEELPERDAEKTIDEGYLRCLEEEINKMTQVLKEQGVAVIEVPWHVTEERGQQRVIEDTIRAICDVVPSTPFLDLHRRTMWQLSRLD